MRMETVNAKLAVFSTNIDTLKARLGATLEPLTKGALDKLGTWAAKLGDFVTAHPDLAKAGLLTGGAIGAAGVVGGTGMVLAGMWALVKGKGIPVFVTNQGGIGGPGGPGLVRRAAGAVGRGIGGLGVEGMAAVALGAAAVAEGVSALASSPAMQKELQSSLTDAFSRSKVSKLEQQRRINASRAALGDAPIVFAKPVAGSQPGLEGGASDPHWVKHLTALATEQTEQTKHLATATKNLGGHIAKKLQQHANASVGASAPAFSFGNPTAGAGASGGGL